jgi:NAD(H)-dependent 7beta-hydroxy-3-oxo-delta4-cholenoic acid oxidoreductase
MQDMKNAKIFQPIKIGGRTFKNRIMMAPMTLSIESFDGTVSPELQQHYIERAEGGVAICEMDAVTVDQGFLYKGPTTCLDDDEFIAPFKAFTDKLHAAGGALFPQVTHPGPESIIGYFGQNPPGPSVYINDNGHFTREMDVDEIHTVIKQYGSACRRAKEAGCDGIALHCAHAYMMPGAFLSPLRNFRCDEYGGSIDNRARFVCEVIDEIRANVGKDFPIIMRISGSERYPGGNTLDDMLYIVPKIVAHGVDAIEVSGGTQFEAPWTIIPSHGEPRGVNVKEAAALKEVLDVPVYVVGKIENLRYANELVERGLVDGVTLGRPFLADPDIVNKSYEGKFDDIAPCASCCGGCVTRNQDDQIAKCNINPRMCRETVYPKNPEKAAKSKKVLVIGGGPGGLMAAKTAAERGHSVTLWEKQHHLGGQVNFAARAPGKQDDMKWIQYLNVQCGKLGAKIELDKEATVEAVKEFAPDAVIIATGATPFVPNIPGVKDHEIVTAQDFLGGKHIITDGRVCILGGGIVALETAEVVQQFHRYYLHDDLYMDIVEMLPILALDLCANNREPMMRRLKAAGAKMHPRTKVLEYRGDTVLVENEKGEQELLGPFDHVLFSMGTRAYNPFGEELAKFVPEVKIVGDAKEARRVVNATREGFDAAMEL